MCTYHSGLRSAASNAAANDGTGEAGDGANSCESHHAGQAISQHVQGVAIINCQEKIRNYI